MSENADARPEFPDDSIGDFPDRERGVPASDKKRTFSPEVEQRMAEIAQQLNDAGMSDHVERFRFFSEKVDELKDNPAGKEAIKNSIKETLEAGQYPIRRENLEHWINEIHPEMEQSDKDELLALVEKMTPDEKGELAEDEESSMEEKKNKLLEDAQTTYDEIEASELDDDRKQVALGMVGRIRGLFNS
jgi:hypothetical protein